MRPVYTRFSSSPTPLNGTSATSNIRAVCSAQSRTDSCLTGRVKYLRSGVPMVHHIEEPVRAHGVAGEHSELCASFRVLRLRKVDHGEVRVVDCRLPVQASATYTSQTDRKDVGLTILLGLWGTNVMRGVRYCEAGHSLVEGGLRSRGRGP
jgi:hypothetical protein